jgi:hypothetical protein
MFRLSPCDLDYVNQAPFCFHHVLDIPLSAQQTFELISSNELEKEWFPDFLAASWREPNDIGVGSIRDYRLTYMQLTEHFIV